MNINAEVSVGRKQVCLVFPVPMHVFLFPGESIPIPLQHKKHTRVLEEARRRGDLLLLAATQKNDCDEDLTIDALQDVGTIARFQVLQLPDGKRRVMLDGENRVRILRYMNWDDFFEAEVEILPDTITRPDATQRTLLAPGDVRVLPVLPIQDLVISANLGTTLRVGREKSMRAIEEVTRRGTVIMLPCQKIEADDVPKPDTIYNVGAIAQVPQLLRVPDGTLRVNVEGKWWGKIRRYTDRVDFFEAEVAVLDHMLGDAVMYSTFLTPYMRTDGLTPRIPEPSFLTFRVYVQAYRNGRPFLYPRAVVEQAFAQLISKKEEYRWDLKLANEECGFVFPKNARDLHVKGPDDIWQFEISHVSRNSEVWNAIAKVLQQTPSIIFWPAEDGVRACVGDPSVIPHIAEWIIEHCGTPAVIANGDDLAQCVGIG